jgi:hypothetical protein
MLKNFIKVITLISPALRRGFILLIIIININKKIPPKKGGNNLGSLGIPWPRIAIGSPVRAIAGFSPRPRYPKTLDKVRALFCLWP